MAKSHVLRSKAFFAGFLLWSGYGVFSAWLAHALRSFGKNPLTWGHAFLLNMSWAYILGTLGIGVVWLASRFRLESPRMLPNLGVLVAGNAAYAVCASAIMQAVYLAAGISRSMPGLQDLWWNLIYQLQDTVPLYWVVVFLFYALDYYLRYQRGLVEAEQLNSQLVRSQLQALKMELHPHFLFNTLHAISELIHLDPATAERMVVGLGQLLRLSLDTNSAVEVPLHQELRFAQLYLDIEKMRFEEKLQVTFDIDPEAQDAMVPNLLLQPLVENSIKHAVAPRQEAARVTLSAKRHSGFLLLTVSDNGGGSAVDGSYSMPPREGVGLRTTRERLQKLYGSSQSFRFTRLPGGGVESSIRIPFRVAAGETEYGIVTGTDC